MVTKKDLIDGLDANPITIANYKRGIKCPKNRELIVSCVNDCPYCMVTEKNVNCLDITSDQIVRLRNKLMLAKIDSYRMSIKSAQRLISELVTKIEKEDELTNSKKNICKG